MAQTTVYTCDICKQSRDKKDLEKIEVKTEGIRIKNCDRYNPLKIDICKGCLKEKGFLVEPKEDEGVQAEKHNEDTLRDMLYNILDELGVVFAE